MIEGLIIDSFAGGGGASTGIEAAFAAALKSGTILTPVYVDYAINHDEEAISMHAVNHPRTEHLPCNIWQVEFDKLVGKRKVGLMWFSPDCKHFSKAKGGKPVKKAIRDLAWVVVKAARQVRPAVIMLENVEEFQDWGPLIFKRTGAGRTVGQTNLFEASELPRPDYVTDDMVLGDDGQPVLIPDPDRKGETFKRWTDELVRLGYHIEWRELRACDYGAPTIRKRFFMIARRDGNAIIWPQPTHGDPKSAPVLAGQLKPWRTAAEIIDWSLPCPSIFMSKEEVAAWYKETGQRVKRPLAAATEDRVAKGVDRYVIKAANPFIVNLTHQGGDRNEPVTEPMNTVTGAHRGEKAVVSPVFMSYAQQGGGNRSAGEPLQTATASTGDQNQIVVPTLVTTGYGEREGQEPRVPELDKPLGTPVAGGVKAALVAPHLMTMRNAQKPFNEADKPTHTITSMGAHLHLVAAFMAQHNIAAGEGHPGHPVSKPVSTILHTGSHQGLAAVHMLDMHGSDMRDAPADEPLRSLTAQGFHAAQVAAFLIKYYGTDQDPQLAEALHSITTKDRFGLVTVEIHGEPYVIVDIGLRMLTPRELFRAQGFPESYIIDVGANGEAMTKTAQVRMCGNSVCPQVAEALVKANLIDEGAARARTRRGNAMEYPLWAEDVAA